MRKYVKQNSNKKSKFEKWQPENFSYFNKSQHNFTELWCDWLKDGNVWAATFRIWIFLYEFCFRFGTLAIEDHVHILG